ncbi:MAG: hypothetical protein E7773_00760 [Sphingomonas sp.]|uniref:hypothetical protein n=1 Tax=Sphingomonas sp. TaxID=28214 RepID=UPI0011FDDC8F|nr:hypothetical protein [Sphingomonas sp.]THD38317.1 MAG: hypothetical protein E7773_00760 [Sphingomonas sp.]
MTHVRLNKPITIGSRTVAVVNVTIPPEYLRDPDLPPLEQAKSNMAASIGLPIEFVEALDPVDVDAIGAAFVAARDQHNAAVMALTGNRKARRHVWKGAR